MATYSYTGVVLVGGIVGKKFNVYKFGGGILHINELISTTSGASGVGLSPNYLQSVFEIIAKTKVITIIKEINNQEDSYIKKQVGREDGNGGFGLRFEGLFNDGASRYTQFLEFWSAEIVSKTPFHERGRKKYSAYTFKTDEAKLYPMSEPI
jgi:hypothetical protein